MTDQTQMTKSERRRLRQEELQKQRAAYSANGTLRRIGVWSFVVIILVGSVWALSRYGSTGSSGTAGYVAGADEVTPTDHLLGNPDAAVTLVEYSDFQCPACASYHPIVKQIMETYGDRVRFVYRHYPLRQIHPNAVLASSAAEAASEQGKFWEMHDLLFARQRSWSDDINAKGTFSDYAEELGLNKDTFLAAMSGDVIADRIATDEASGNRLGIAGTPTFFLNGEKLSVGATFEQFAAQLDEKLNAQP
ncbi:MAG: thioredoxin domain-containing protein [Patescibacteria group bacterium]